jgi:cell division protein YceG involved in septum cleavage
VNLITRAAELGFIDPASGFADPGVDAIPAKLHGALIELLNFIANSRMKDSYYIKKYREYTKDKNKLAEEIAKACESKEG